MLGLATTGAQPGWLLVAPLSAPFALTRDLTGAFSGEGVAAFGYAGGFGLTTLLAVPGLALLRSPALRGRIESVRRAES